MNLDIKQTFLKNSTVQELSSLMTISESEQCSSSTVTDPPVHYRISKLYCTAKLRVDGEGKCGTIKDGELGLT